MSDPTTWGRCAFCHKTERVLRMEQRDGKAVCDGCADSYDMPAVREELKTRREAMARMEWQGRQGYEGELRACPYCEGIDPDVDEEDLESYPDHGLVSDHRPACIYSKYPTEENDGE